MEQYSVEAVLKAIGGKEFVNAFKEAQDAVKGFENSSKKLGEIGSSFKKVGKAMTLGITAPVIAGVTAAVKSYANLEQAVGGIETLFKGSASGVIKNSESAYKRAGVSGVKYMEQVTSFSATLLQGLGGDTEKAAGYADKAIVDMSDNANKFGTNIGDIQNAYQGFAKDNYTMLDNLKLGYGGTASEMARLVNESGVMGDSFEATAENVKDIPFDQLIEAIHQTQVEMDVTGTTAKEASETVSGSFDSMKSAGENLLAGLGDSNADIGALMDNLGLTVENFVNNVKGVLSTIWDNLPLTDFQKWVASIAIGAGPVLFVFGAVLSAISKVGSAIQALPAILALLTSPVGLAVIAIAALIAIGVLLWQNWDTIKEKLSELKDKFIADWEELKNIAGTAMTTLKDSALEDFEELKTGATNSVETLKTSAIEDFNELKTIGSNAMETLKSAAVTDANELKTGASNAIKTLKTAAISDFNQLKSGGSNAISTLKNAGVSDFNQLKSIASNAVSTLKSTAISQFNELKNGAVRAWNTLKSTTSSVFNSLKGTISSALSNINLFSAGKAIIDGFLRGLKSAYEGVKSFVSGIAGWIESHKGPISYDKKLLIGAGNAIMGGLNKGLQTSFKDVQSTVSGMAGSIYDTMNTSPVMDINGSIARSNAQVKSSVSHELKNNTTVNKQPANLTFNLGNKSYRAFVDDISNTQNAQIQLTESYL